MMAFYLPAYQPMPRRDDPSPVRIVVRPAWQMPLNDRRDDDSARASQLTCRPSSLLTQR
ncbi:MAG TPA: hypothetical protein VFX24_07890 [Ktedonobacterales bacterium]|jgi:hypothetical protein|nr:hypothetical protein [Ktedonobacterales bacterium]